MAAKGESFIEKERMKIEEFSVFQYHSSVLLFYRKVTRIGLVFIGDNYDTEVLL